MARTVQEIQDDIIASFVAEMDSIGVAQNPATWSRTNIYNILFYVVAVCAFTVETLFDIFRTETETKIRELKPHTERWYANRALAYQHGHDLIPEGDTYDNTGIDEADITTAKVVKYAAVIEQVNQYGRVSLRIKLATEDNADLAPLDEYQIEGVREYFKRIKDAGVMLKIDSLPADSLQMSWSIYYDPLILNAQGARLDGLNSDPVGDAIRQYLKNLPFNGTFVLAYIMDAVQAVEGVVIPDITDAKAKYGELEFTAINVKYEPDAGYLRVYEDADLNLTFIPQSVIK